MGFFSWLTADTKETIANVHSNHKNAKRTVYLLQPDGELAIEERAYDGYGDFGGIDAYSWLSKMNGGSGDRDDGINLFFHDRKRTDLKYHLKFSFNREAVYENLPPSDDCSNQGYFY